MPTDALLRMVEDSSRGARRARWRGRRGDVERRSGGRAAGADRGGGDGVPKLRIALESVSAARHDDPEAELALVEALSEASAMDREA